MNTLKTTFLLTALTLLLLFFGKALGGNGGMMVALVMAGEPYPCQAVATAFDDLLADGLEQFGFAAGPHQRLIATGQHAQGSVQVQQFHRPYLVAAVCLLHGVRHAVQGRGQQREFVTSPGRWQPHRPVAAGEPTGEIHACPHRMVGAADNEAGHQKSQQDGRQAHPE